MPATSFLLGNLVGTSKFHGKFSSKPNQDAFKTDQGILPILADRGKIIETLDTCQVLVIRGETGSGKTTCVPQFILDHHASRMEKCKIWVTQPRKIAARTVSMRVAERDEHWNRGVRSGYGTKDGEEINTENIPSFPNIVGYHVGLDKCTHPDSRIIYMTPGKTFFVPISNLSSQYLHHVFLKVW